MGSKAITVKQAIVIAIIFEIDYDKQKKVKDFLLSHVRAKKVHTIVMTKEWLKSSSAIEEMKNRGADAITLKNLVPESE